MSNEATFFFEALTREPEPSPSYGYFGLAWMAFDRRDWDEAVRLSELAVKAAPPGFSGPFLLWNRAVGRRGKADKAEAYYRLWIQREPGTALAEFALHNLHVWAGQATSFDLDKMRLLHAGDRDLLEAWMLAEYQVGKRQRALAAIQEVVAISLARRDGELEYLANNYAVQVFRDLGLHREAGIAATRAQGSAERYGDTNRAIFLLYQTCSIRFDLGEPSAEDLCRAAADRALSSIGNAATASDALTRLANIAESKGHYGAAAEHLERALDAASRSGFKMVEAIRRRDLALLFLGLGQTDQADPLLRQALQAAQEDGTQWQAQSQTLATLGRCTSMQGRAAEGQRYFTAALAIAIKEGDKESEQVAWTEMALAASATGDLPRATQALNNAIRLATESGQRPTVMQLLATSGHLKIRLGQWDEAAKQFEESLSIGVESGRFDTQWESRFGLGLIAERNGQTRPALLHFHAAIAASEDSRSRIPDLSWRGLFFATRQELYHHAVGLLADERRLAESFNALERSRARTMLDLASSPEGQGLVLDAEGKELATALSIAEKNLLDAILGNVREQEAVRLRHAAETAAMDYKRYLSRLRAKTSSAPALAEQNPASLQEIQSRLPQGTAVLSYSIGPRRGLLFVVTRKHIRAYQVPSRTKLEVRIAEMAALIGRPPQRLTSGRLDRLLHLLYIDLLAPAEVELRQNPRWLVSADGPVQKVPFAALLDRPVAHGEARAFLLRRANISFVPSASMWLHLRDRSKQLRDRPDRSRAAMVVAIGDSVDATSSASYVVSSKRSLHFGALPGARREIRAITNLYGKGAGVSDTIQLRLGAQATEPETKRLLQVARIAHLAVHGYADTARPQSSALILAPTDKGNGLLQAYEIQEMRLPHLELVVLSACETLIGKDVPGEGVQALAGSFLLAGAREVVGSMWKIADASTATLMFDFHRQLRKVASVSQALRTAQLSAIRNPARAHPFFWAGLQVIGAENDVN